MLRLSDLMTQPVLALVPGMALREALDTLVAHGVSGAPVVVGGRVLGVVSVTDLIELEAAEPDVTDIAWELGDEHRATVPADAVPVRAARAARTVEEVMDRRLHALPPDAEIGHATEMMRRAGTHRVLVMSGGELVGILTITDIARAAAEHGLEVRRHALDRQRRADRDATT